MNCPLCKSILTPNSSYGDEDPPSMHVEWDRQPSWVVAYVEGLEYEECSNEECDYEQATSAIDYQKAVDLARKRVQTLAEPASGAQYVIEIKSSSWSVTVREFYPGSRVPVPEVSAAMMTEGLRKARALSLSSTPETRLINALARYTRLLELQAPEAILENEWKLIQKYLGAWRA